MIFEQLENKFSWFMYLGSSKGFFLVEYVV